MKVQNAQGQPVPGTKVEIDRKDGLTPVLYIFDGNGTTVLNDPSLYVPETVFKFTAPGYMVTYYTGDQLGNDATITLEKETVNVGLLLLIGVALIGGFYLIRKK